MVRTMPKIPFHKIAFLPPPITFFVMVIAILSILFLVTFLCGSHEKATKSQKRRGEKTVQLGEKKKAVARLQSNISSKALLLAKMISWRKVQDEEEEEENDYDDEEEAIWRKTIIKGEKCRPLNFSGKILYDSKGNLIPDSD
ncbi:hypothetical protein ACH5RR_011634 [Cinchona calisaya]|uniref:Transmembrane protein n=1 Tax=Cinchona calisaya TaxID=153742 RepID=A0ABD3A609_9GENT